MIITKDKIYNNTTVLLDETNSSVVDIGTESAYSRDEVIYLDFVTNQLPSTLHVQLINTASSSIHLTNEGLEFCEIDLQAATLQENAPNNWGDKYYYGNALSSCANKYDNHWPYVLNEGLAIVNKSNVYHIYYVLHNPVHRSGLNWKFGSGYITYDNNVSEIYMEEPTSIKKSLKIGSTFQIDVNGLQNISGPSEQTTFSFSNWDETESTIHLRKSEIVSSGARHDVTGIDDYFTFTNPFSQSEKEALLPDVSIHVKYVWWWNDTGYFADATIKKNSTDTIAMSCPGISSKNHGDYTSDSCGFITKYQLHNESGNNLATTCNITYRLGYLQYIYIPLLYSGDVYFHSSKTKSELWIQGDYHIIHDTNGHMWTVKLYNSSTIELRPNSSDLPHTYRPTFSEFYSIIKPDANLIPLLSPIELTATYHEGTFTRGAIGAIGTTVKYYPKNSTTTEPVLILAYVDIKE